MYCVGFNIKSCLTYNIKIAWVWFYQDPYCICMKTHSTFTTSLPIIVTEHQVIQVWQELEIIIAKDSGCWPRQIQQIQLDTKDAKIPDKDSSWFGQSVCEATHIKMRHSSLKTIDLSMVFEQGQQGWKMLPLAHHLPFPSELGWTTGFCHYIRRTLQLAVPRGCATPPHVTIWVENGSASLKASHR